MRIKRIQFSNYRCFLDEEVLFPQETEKQNINLFIAPNGGGKTEFLFAFWWALYPGSFKFSDLKGKEATAYSINSDIYFQLERGPVGIQNKCFVEVEFEHENITYVITRTETFSKSKNNSIANSLTCSFYRIDNNGITSTPITDPNDVNSQLERILPQKVLSGIIFDGERMKKISSIDNESIKSIEGVIADITNKEVLNSFESELGTLKNFYQRSIKKSAVRSSTLDLEEISKSIILKEKEFEELKTDLAKNKQEIPFLKSKVLEKSEVLQSLEHSSKIELDLTKATNDLKHYDNNYEEALGTLKAQMSMEGPFLLTKKLVKDLDNVIKNSEVPLGLNVKIVSNILKNDSCICGNSFTNEMRNNLHDLTSQLPPNDINATIKEQKKTIQLTMKKSEGNIDNLFNAMDDNYQESGATKRRIAQLKTQLTESVSKKVAQLEVDREKYEMKINVINKENLVLSQKISIIDKEISNLKIEQERLAEREMQTKLIQSRRKFVEKAIRAIQGIQENYRMIALNEINVLFQTAYKNISEDYDFGRRVYLTHILNEKYMMVTYNESELISYLKNTKGYSEKEILLENVKADELEQAIDAIKISNSTGQQTVMSLAFVKAILDYSRRESGTQDHELKKVKSYPVVIDAPFSDLSGDNLKNAASGITGFSEQVLLLINEESYNSIRSKVDSNLCGVHYFIKDENKQSSRISEGREASIG